MFGLGITMSMNPYNEASRQHTFIFVNQSLNYVVSNLHDVILQFYNWNVDVDNQRVPDVV